MIVELNKNSLLKKNLSLIFNRMIPGDKFMPCFTKAVKIDTIMKIFKKHKVLHNLNLENKPINLNEKKNWEKYTKIFGNDILNAYFTSNLAIKSLNLRRKFYLKNVKDENILELVKKNKSFKLKKDA